jgi:hypothetical protein
MDPAHSTLAANNVMIDVHNGDASPSLAAQGVASPGRNIAFALCSDGVVPTKKGGRGYWPVALQCLNLPPWLRTKMNAMMLCCVMANTTASADMQPTLEIVVDELNSLYREGIHVHDAHLNDDIKVHAMLLDVRSDFPGTSKMFRYTAGGAYVASCYECEQLGIGHGSSKRVYTGAWKFCSCDTVAGKAVRQAGCKLHRPSEQANTRQANTAWRAERPKPKDDVYFRQAARTSDLEIVDGPNGGLDPDKRPVSGSTAPVHSRWQSGVKSSHVFQKLPYWTEAIKGLDPMHTLGGCIGGVFKMVAGDAYSDDVVAKVCAFELHDTCNGRWRELLGDPDTQQAHVAATTTAKKKRKRRKPPSTKLVLPWKASKQASREAEGLLHSMVKVGAAPAGIADSNIRYCLTHPGWLKTHEFFMLSGLIGKYALLGTVDEEQYTAACAVLDACSALWQVEVKKAHMERLKEQVHLAVARFELVVPAWEMDIMLHLLLHVVDRMQRCGPCWSFSMFSFERMWGAIDKWRTQQRHMEACIMNAFRAYRVAYTMVVSQASVEAGGNHTDSDDESCDGDAGTEDADDADVEGRRRPSDGDDDGSGSDDDGGGGGGEGMVRERGGRARDMQLDRQYDAALLLPFYARPYVDTEAVAEVYVELYDQAATILIGEFHKDSETVDKDWWRVELHRYYYNKYGGVYRDTFNKFIADAKPACLRGVHTATGDLKAHKAQELLELFEAWGDTQRSTLSVEELSCSARLDGEVFCFDRLRLNGMSFSCMAVDKYKKSKNSIVMTIADGKPYIGRVVRYIKHRIPQFTTSLHGPSAANTEDIAQVEWLADLGVHPQLDCPVVSRDEHKWDSGCLIACKNLCPTNVILAPHPEHDDRYVVLHRQSALPT